MIQSKSNRVGKWVVSESQVHFLHNRDGQLDMKLSWLNHQYKRCATADPFGRKRKVDRIIFDINIMRDCCCDVSGNTEKIINTGKVCGGISFFFPTSFFWYGGKISDNVFPQLKVSFEPSADQQLWRQTLFHPFSGSNRCGGNNVSIMCVNVMH